MLTRLELKDLTVFPRAEFDFAAGLNVIVGENGAGKSHVLKVAYSILAVLARGERESASGTPTKAYLESAIAKKLRGVLRPDALGRLARRQAGRARCEIRAYLRSGSKKEQLGFSFNTASKTEVAIENLPTRWTTGEAKPPLYLPTRELLTIYPGFVSLYETTELPFEQTWRDTCVLLGSPLAKGTRLKEIAQLLGPLEEQLGGKVLIEDDRFYLVTETGKLEVHLVAEGFRKLAMVARLIATGSLFGSGSLFWDEPEANLNPKVIKQVARTILQLCKSGIQVFIATHSLFLLRELDILHRLPEFDSVRAKFFSLHVEDSAVTLRQGETVDDIGSIDALQEELSQSDRYLSAGVP